MPSAVIDEIKSLKLAEADPDSPKSLLPASPEKSNPVPADDQPLPDIDLGPLPQGWEMAVTETGDHYFIE